MNKMVKFYMLFFRWPKTLLRLLKQHLIVLWRPGRIHYQTSLCVCVCVLTNWSSSMAVRCLGHIYVVTSLFSNYFKKTVHVRALESVKANPQIDLPVINSLLYGFGGCRVMGFMCICLSIPHALVSFLLGRFSMIAISIALLFHAHASPIFVQILSISSVFWCN